MGLALGTLTFWLIESFFDIKNSILALVVFFAFGLILLIRIPKPEQQAHETSH